MIEDDPLFCKMSANCSMVRNFGHWPYVTTNSGQQTNFLGHDILFSLNLCSSSKFSRGWKFLSPLEFLVPTLRTTQSVPNYKLLWLYWYIHFAMYLDTHTYNKIDVSKKSKRLIIWNGWSSWEGEYIPPPPLSLLLLDTITTYLKLNTF